MKLPFDLPPASRVLVAGAGGGFDVVCGLPIALELKAAGHTVHLANICTSPMEAIGDSEWPVPWVCKVLPDTLVEPKEAFLPELGLSRWWSEASREPRPVWCIKRGGVRPVQKAYEYLRDEFSLDHVVLVDGGVDGLFIGNEHVLGTPSLDAISILAASRLSDCRGIFVTTAFGTEGWNHEVRHADALRRMAELVRWQACLGVTALLPGTEAGEGFADAVAAIHKTLAPEHHSVIASSIVAAMRGDFGNIEPVLRTRNAPIWVSPLTILYWFFDLYRVAESKPYGPDVLESETVTEVTQAIDRVRETIGVLPATDIPI